MEFYDLYYQISIHPMKFLLQTFMTFRFKLSQEHFILKNEINNIKVNLATQNPRTSRCTVIIKDNSEHTCHQTIFSHFFYFIFICNDYSNFAFMLL